MFCNDKIVKLMSKIKNKKKSLIGSKEQYNKIGIYDFDDRYDEVVKLLEEIEQDAVDIIYDSEDGVN